MSQYDDLAELYDHEWKELVQDIGFVRELVSQTGGPVLELACGTGRLTFPVAETGAEIVALDNSRKMLQIAEKRLSDKYPDLRENVHFEYGDMKNFDLGKKFALIFIPFNSFLLLAQKSDQEMCLRSIHKHLRDDGLAMIDVFSPKFSLCAQTKPEIRFLKHFSIPDKQKVVIEWEYVERNMAEQKMEIDFLYEIYDKDGNIERTTKHLTMGLIFRYEMQFMLEKNGFEIVHFYGDYDKSSFTINSPQLIYIFKKA